MPKPWGMPSDDQAAGMRAAQKIAQAREAYQNGEDFFEAFSQVTDEEREYAGRLEAYGYQGHSTFKAGTVFCPDPDKSETISDTAQNPSPAKK